MYFIVNLDLSSNAFSIIPIDKGEYDRKISEPVKANDNQEDTVEKNDNNLIPQKYYEEADIIDIYLQDYIELALFNPEMAYQTINEDYRIKKFETYQEYEEYIAEKREELETMCKSIRKQYTDFETYQEYEEYYRQVSKTDIKQYKVEEINGKKRYICIAGNDRYYIFDINSIMDYTVILDTYTVDLPEFTEQYNSANDSEKAGLNLQKVVDALNDKDYKYVYNKLDETFKENNFPDLDKFKQYVEDNLYTSIEAEFSDYKNSGNIHMYDVSFKNKKDQNDTPITKTFIIKLLDGTDFTMSFNV